MCPVRKESSFSFLGLRRSQPTCCKMYDNDCIHRAHKHTALLLLLLPSTVMQRGDELMTE